MRVFVRENDKVKKGDKLMEFDIEYIKEHAKSEACIGVFTSLEEGQEIVMKTEGDIEPLGESQRSQAFNNRKKKRSCMECFGS